MVHRHKHSKEAEQRRYVRRLVLTLAFRDKQNGEAVNILSPADIAGLAGKVFDGFMPSAADNFERGEVLSDGRGQGTMQR